jgi:hypothetical protein
MMTSDELVRFRSWHKTFTAKNELPTQRNVLDWITKDRETQMQAYRATTKRYGQTYYNLMGLQPHLFNLTPRADMTARAGEEVYGTRAPNLPGYSGQESPGEGPGGGNAPGVPSAVALGMVSPTTGAIAEAVAAGLLGFGITPQGNAVPSISTPTTAMALHGISIPGILGKASQISENISNAIAAVNALGDLSAMAEAQAGPLSGGMEAYGSSGPGPAGSLGIGTGVGAMGLGVGPNSY